MPFLPVFALMSEKPHNHKGWATLMAFASINPIKPRTDLWKFRKKNLRIGDFENILFFFCFILMKISPNLYGRMVGLKFWCFPWFPENSLLRVILRYRVYILQISSWKKHSYTANENVLVALGDRKFQTLIKKFDYLHQV